MAGVAMMTTVCAALLVPKTLPRNRRRPRPARAGGGPGQLRRLLGSREFMIRAAVFWFSSGAFFAYVAASPFLYRVQLGLSAQSYSVLFGINALLLVATSWMCVWLLRRGIQLTVLTVGVMSLAAATATQLVVQLVCPGSVILTSALLGWTIGSVGLVNGPSSARALDWARESAGSASALLGAGQCVLAAMVSPLVGVAGEASGLPMAVVMAALSVISAWALWIGMRRESADRSVRVDGRPAGLGLNTRSLRRPMGTPAPGKCSRSKRTAADRDHR